MTDFQALLSSSAVPVAAGDTLVVELTPRSGFQPTVTVRTIAQDKDGNLIPAAITKVLAADGSTQKLVLEQATGVLFYMSVDCQTSGVSGGELFATAYIQQGRVIAQQNNLYLTSGYVATGSPLIYPAQSSGNTSTQWSPTIAEAFPDPGASNPIAVILNSNKQSFLTGFKFRFQTDLTSPGTALAITLSSNGSERFRFTTRTALNGGNSASFWGVLGSELPADDAANFNIYFPIPAQFAGLICSVNVDIIVPTAGDSFEDIRAFYYSQTSF